MEMLATFPATSPAHDLLQRLFDEQYAVKDGKAVLRDKKEVKADSLQNPNDPDATYRAKNDQKVQGYVTNITETVEEGKPNIITSVQVETAVFADCHFLQEAVEISISQISKPTLYEMPFCMYQMTKRRRHKSKLQLAHNSWPTHAHHLLCKRISADMQAHNSCCATGDTN